MKEVMYIYDEILLSEPYGGLTPETCYYGKATIGRSYTLDTQGNKVYLNEAIDLSFKYDILKQRGGLE